MLLLLLQFVPFIGALLIGSRTRLAPERARTLALFWSLIPWILIAAMGRQLHAAPGLVAVDCQWTLPWIPEAGMSLRFAADGMAMIFLALTAMITTFALATSRTTGPSGRGFVALVLVLESMLFGVFTARHFIPWFLCWEMTLIPAFLLVRIWGGPAASLASLRFFAVTLAGSLCTLAGFLVLQWSVGTMDFDALARMAADGQLAGRVAAALPIDGWSPPMILAMVAGLVFLGLAVKLPVVPVHAWLPAAYAEAPAPVSMLLTGVLSKMGVQGLLVLFLPVFREAMPVLAPWLMGIALATILLSAFAALAQEDMKRMLAYSSVNHLGYCLLAVAAVGSAGAGSVATTSALAGVVMQAFNHGVIASTLFCCAGLLEQRAGTRMIGGFGGVRASMPLLAGFTGLAAFASLGLPMLGGFVGEFLIFRGVFEVSPWAAAAAAPALFVTALFLLRWQRRVFHGPIHPEFAGLKDLQRGELIMLAMATIFIILPGVWPQSLLHWLQDGALLRLTPPMIP